MALVSWPLKSYQRNELPNSYSKTLKGQFVREQNSFLYWFILEWGQQKILWKEWKKSVIHDLLTLSSWGNIVVLFHFGRWRHFLLVSQQWKRLSINIPYWRENKPCLFKTHAVFGRAYFWKKSRNAYFRSLHI